MVTYSLEIFRSIAKIFDSFLKNLGNPKLVNLLKEDNIDTYRDKRNCFLLHEATSDGKFYHYDFFCEETLFHMHLMLTFANQAISKKYAN